MATKDKRIDINDLNRGQVIVLSSGHPDTLIAYPTNFLTIQGGSIDYTKYLTSSLYSAGLDVSAVNEEGEVQSVGGISLEDIILDIPDISDIENVTYEPYYDTTAKAQKVRAILKIRNSSKNASNVDGIDVRIFNPTTTLITISSGDLSKAGAGTPSTKFITPTPAVPNVYFKRDGTAIAWGWNNVSGLGSFSQVRYDWIISSSSSSTAPALKSGSETYSTTSTYNIGTSGVSKTYRVSSRDGDVSATSSFRWLRVKTVVTGTNGVEYSSAYSTPI